jgi:crossover junction endodeoxyribonuclease RuvC
MPRVLGVDPGSLITGWGLIEGDARRLRPCLFGTVRPSRRLPLPDRLQTLYRDLRGLMSQHAPDVVAVETAFYHKNVKSTLVLGHVRGVVLLAARETGIAVQEYAPRDIKLAVTGNGGAGKEQVAFMVKSLLAVSGKVPADAADALAVALCHWNRSRLRPVSGGRP